MLLLLLLAGLFAPPKPPNRPTAQPVVVLELFTSQGCSSCPAADRVLQQLTERASASGQAVYGLSFHVDYWNRLGWRDPFSQPLFTQRQQQYDRLLHTQTYTPQLIINGRQDFVGSQKNRIETAIQHIQQQPATTFVGIGGRMNRSARQLMVQYTLSASGPYRVNVAVVQQQARTVVQSGENGGRTLVNSNVVRQFSSVAASPEGRITLPLPGDLAPDQLAVLLYVQRTDNQQIVGAVRL